jgi:hypothetical protein
VSAGTRRWVQYASAVVLAMGGIVLLLGTEPGIWHTAAFVLGAAAVFASIFWLERLDK